MAVLIHTKPLLSPRLTGRRSFSGAPYRHPASWSRRYPQSCLVEATTKPFVTIRDFVKTAHPWLIALEGAVRRAKDIIRASPVPVTAEMCVNGISPNPFMASTSYGPSARIAEEWRGLAMSVTMMIRKRQVEDAGLTQT
ncbi:hypothetical protein GGS23DRAFT_80408 [Durotheca rogersii]|uniref:uncharacterized protein n=1 Tax=Durotheca rogersii TaxID=419775 RepID=UPI00221F1E30|nr:uncharacterized protein GGS23DRAFT_80408 [Durotheca rogersii]KAI5862530.1 hypothetical protein GGS23DRAFT_80408 [Durotheca rogersii]